MLATKGDIAYRKSDVIINIKESTTVEQAVRLRHQLQFNVLALRE